MMAAARYDIAVEQGATFNRVITWLDPAGAPISLTGARVEFQWRAPDGPPLVNFDSAALTAGLTLGHALDATGVINFSVSNTLTAALSFGSGAWDLFVTLAGGERERLLYGNVKLLRSVTR